jgi:CRISPR-associated protein Cas2
MTVMILERVTPSLRGELSRWLVEIATGTFVGRVSGLVRDELWKRCTERAPEGSVLQVWRINEEQGFDLRSHNLRDRIPVRIEGLWLAMIPRADDASIVDVTGTEGVRRGYTIDIPPAPEDI